MSQMKAVKEALLADCPAIVRWDKAINKQRVGGFSRRCTLIVLGEFFKLAEEG